MEWGFDEADGMKRVEDVIVLNISSYYRGNNFERNKIGRSWSFESIRERKRLDW